MPNLLYRYPSCMQNCCMQQWFFARNRRQKVEWLKVKKIGFDAKKSTNSVQVMTACVYYKIIEAAYFYFFYPSLVEQAPLGFPNPMWLEKIVAFETYDDLKVMYFIHFCRLVTFKTRTRKALKASLIHTKSNDFTN